jgi:hypothetical protein
VSADGRGKAARRFGANQGGTAIPVTKI